MNAQELAKTADRLRIDILTMITEAGSGHPGGSLSAIDLLVALYGTELKHDPKNGNDPARDRFILSKGHGCLALYAVLADKGFFDPAEENPAEIRAHLVVEARQAAHADRRHLAIAILHRLDRPF